MIKYITGMANTFSIIAAHKASEQARLEVVDKESHFPYSGWLIRQIIV